MVSLFAVAGIVIRHDVADQRYLVSRSDYPFLARINRSAEGALVGDKWVLTAGHVVAYMNPFNNRVVIAGKAFTVKKALYHPLATSPNFRKRVDLALLLLDRPATGVKPIGLYDRADEAGQTMTMLGAGMTGTGLTGMKVYDRKTRRAQNRIESATDRHLIVRFDRDGLETEGIPGEGDSGGAAIVTRNGTPVLVGIVNKNEPAEGGPIAGYGSEGVFARVSTQRTWIKETMAGKKSPDWGWSAPTSKISNACVSEFFASFNAGTKEAAEGFFRKWPSQTEIADRWTSRKSMIERFGILTPRAYTVGPTKRCLVLAETSKAVGYWWTLCLNLIRS